MTALPSILFGQIHPRSKDDLIVKIRYLLGDSLEQIVDTHNTGSVIFISRLGSNDKIFIKAEYGGSTATHKEIRWYEEIKRRKINGVRVLGTHSANSYALLVLEYLENAHNIDVLVQTSAVQESTVHDAIFRAIRADQCFLMSGPTTETPKAVAAFFRNKYEQRRQECMRIPYLKQLLSLPFIYINGKAHPSIDRVFERICSGAASSYLTPQKMGFIHGDLHCGNILLQGKQMYIVDPNGLSALPIEYDIGKILHSIHGGYGAIMHGKYILFEHAKDTYTFRLHNPHVYETAVEKVKQALHPQMYIRGLYTEALHFATMLPHHAARRRETVALFLRALQLFSELLEAVV